MPYQNFLFIRTKFYQNFADSKKATFSRVFPKQILHFLGPEKDAFKIQQVFPVFNACHQVDSENSS